MTEIARQAEDRVKDCLQRNPAVILVGSRRVGKTTLARKICQQHEAGCVYFDLDDSRDLDSMGDPEVALAGHEGKLIVIDEISRKTELFSFLRHFIDKQERAEGAANKFLLLGSASDSLFQQQQTTLTGLVARVRMSGLNCLEAASYPMHKLWNVGGYPKSLLAANDAASEEWRRELIQEVLGDPRLYSTRGLNRTALGELLEYLALTQGGIMNKSNVASDMQFSPNTVGNYLEHLEYLFLIRRLPCYIKSNKAASKRLSKASKYFVCDSGLAHLINNTSVSADGEVHPRNLKGSSWEGFVIENMISVFAPEWTPHFYRMQSGAEVDLVIEFRGERLWTIEIKAGTHPSVTRGHREVLEDLQPERSFIVHQGNDQWSTESKTLITSLPDMMKILIDEQGGANE